mmetsp:Transcript_13413/g.23584  ORF Transcript_13413/g.23584 Transcript_13413/m.23584 type:complete len:1058 (+) Transcript_13413:190-3363(+)
MNSSLRPPNPLGATRRGRSSSQQPPGSRGSERSRNGSRRASSTLRSGSASRGSRSTPSLPTVAKSLAGFGDTRSSSIGRRNSKGPSALPPLGMKPKDFKESWTAKTPEDVKRSFKEADVSGNGALDRDEFRELFRSLNSTLSDKQVEVLYDQIDADGDGEIQFTEFIDYIFEIGDGHGANKSDFAELDVEMPMGGGGLVLGGKMGNAVVKKGFMTKIKVGWRAVALNGERMDPETLVEAMRDVGRKNHFTLTFLVDDKTALNMVNKTTPAAHDSTLRGIARRELSELLGCTDLIELENQPEEQRQAHLANPRVAQLLVEAHAVSEAAVLLRLSSGEEEIRHATLFTALNQNLVDEAMDILKGAPPTDFSRRDEDGNVPLHAAGDVRLCNEILSQAPDCRTLLNLDGRNPLNEQLVRHPEGLDPAIVNRMLGEDPEERREILLACDKDGICAAMRMEPGAFAADLPSWEEVYSALCLDAADMLPALERLGGKEWPGLIALHCFQDPLKEGEHTPQSWKRIGMIWQSLSQLLRGCMLEREECLGAAKALLKATKGPNLPPIDMRLPYRSELQEMFRKLHEKSGHAIATGYEKLVDEDSQWLKNEVRDSLSEDIIPDKFEEAGLRKRLHMDFRCKSGGHGASPLEPDWINETTPRLDQVYADLEDVGMLGAVRKKDAVFDMLRLGGMGEIDSFAGDQDSLLLMRYYGAYMRGLCQGQQETLNTTMQHALGDAAVRGENYFARAEAKAFARIIEKSLVRIEEINQEVVDQDLDPKLGSDARTLLRRAPASICDVNGATLVAQTPTELRAMYNELKSKFRVLRTKNTYSSKADTGDYRDLKLFIAVDSDIGELVVEVQLILASDYQEKKWMHLPYVFERGDLDWEYTRKGLPTEYLFNEGWRLYHGHQGAMSKRDLKQAQDFMVAAAQQGHFVARGMCHREGWGSWRRDDTMAMSCFSAAAQGQVGRCQALCRMAMNYVSSMKDVAVLRRRGLELLREAANGGEPEAFYQLALQEYSHREQQSLFQQAARLGHQRAKLRLSYSFHDPSGSGPSRRLADLVDA